MYLRNANEDEVYKVIINLRNTNSYLEGDIPTYMWKHIAHTINYPLAMIINSSFQTGEFPEKLKTTKIIPIHKKNEKDVISNYRPISILYIMAKVVEKVFLTRLNLFLKKGNILPFNQYGFREKCSTKDGVMDALLYIEEQKDKKQLVAVMLKDLSQAFDSCSHKKLLHKCQHIGIRGLPLKWIESYLTKRTFTTQVNGYSSQSAETENGMPQGGVLSPTFFNIYVFDYPYITEDKCIQFADDTNDILTNPDKIGLMRCIEENYSITKIILKTLT